MAIASLIVVLRVHQVFATTETDNSNDPRQAPAELPTVSVSASDLESTMLHTVRFTRSDIERDAPADLVAFLNRRVGVVVDRSARSGGFGSLYLRGADPSHVVILIDGIRQNDPLSSRGSAVDLNTLTLEDIDRIEVVRGNTSVEVGEAIAGVVRIFTRPVSQRAKSAVGGTSGQRGLASMYGELATSETYTTAAAHEDGDSSEAGLTRTKSINAGIQHESSPISLRAEVRYADANSLGFPDDSGGPQYAVLREREMRDSSSQQAALSVATLEDGPNYVLVTVDTYKKEGNDRSPGVAPGLRDPFGLPAQISRGDYDRYSFNALWRTSALNILDFMFGVDRQEEVGSLDGLLFLGTWVPTHFKIDRNTNALFVEGRSTVGPIIAQLGLRNDFTSGKSPIRHPAASLNYELPGGAGSIGTTWSSAAKLPSFYALGDPIVGNPLLKPESSRQEEIHYASPYTSAVQTQFTAFRADYRDLVDFDPGPPPRLVNRARIRSTGLEFDVTTNLTDAIQASVVGTWMSIGDPNGGPPLRYRPKLQVGFAADVRLASGWRLHGGAAYTGQRHDSAIPTGDLLLGGYSATDLALTRSFEGCDLTLALDNIFNHRIEETIGTFVNDRRLRLVVRFFH